MSDLQRRLRLPRPRVLLSIVGLLALIGLVAFLTLRGAPAQTDRPFDLIYPRRDTIVATVNATGQIEPAQIASLSFSTPGRVAEVLVRVGDAVEQGEPLARLDTREPELRLAQADAQLAQAQANYEKLAAGATPSDLAQAEAQLAQAQGQFRQTTGAVSAADLAQAEAQLEQARLVLQAAEAGADPTELRLAEAQLAQTQAQLATQRDQLSAAKTNAEIALQQAANSLIQAQARYATAKANWEYVQDTGNDPLSRSIVDPTSPGGSRPNRLNDSQQRQYYDAFVQAEAQLRNAEESVRQAQVALDNARQAEINGIRVAEEQVGSAQARYDQVSAGASPDQLAAAQAQVAAAQANLNRLRGDQRSGALAAAQAAVEQAQVRLEQLRAGPDPSDLAVVRAQLLGAQAAYDLAQLSLDGATLTAPFDGVVAEVNLQTGELSGAARPPVVLADLSSYHITVRVDEIDIARLQASQPVTLTLDALPGLEIPGQVESIAPVSVAQTQASAVSAVTTYQVLISVLGGDGRVKPGMSATADIVVARKDAALLLPRRAVRNDRGRLVVDVARDSAACSAPAEQRVGRPPTEPREVRTGLSNELLIEILGGIDERTCVYVEGIDARLRNFLGGGPAPGVRRS